MATKSVNYVKITPGREGRVNVTWAVTTTIKPLDDGRFSCIIPAFKIHFTANDEDAIERKTIALTKMHMDHYILHTKGRFKALVMNLHSLGFKAPLDELVISQFAHDKVVKTKFKAENVASPAGFIEQNAIVQTAEMELA